MNIKNILGLIFFTLIFLAGCNYDSFYNQVKKMNDNFDYDMYLYGNYPTGETTSDNLPDNFDLNIVDDLNFNYTGLSILIVNKELSAEELSEINEKYISGLAIVFYHCENDGDLINSLDYEFCNMHVDYDETYMIATYDYLKTYHESYSGTTYSLVSQIESWLEIHE